MRGIFFWIIFTELAKCKVFRYTNKVDFYRGVEKKYLGGLISPRPRCNSGPRNIEN